MEGFQISGFQPPCKSPTWMNDQRSLWFDVEQYSKICNTPSPNNLKESLIKKYGTSHSPGIPLITSSRHVRPHTTLRLTRGRDDGNRSKERSKRLMSASAGKEKCTLSLTSLTLDGSLEQLQPLVKGMHSELNRCLGSDPVDSLEANPKQSQSLSAQSQHEEEVRELNILLKEKELFYKMDLKKIMKEAEDKEVRIHQEHKAFVRSLEENQKEELKKIQEFHRKMVDDLRRSAEAREEDLKKDIERLSMSISSLEEKHEQHLNSKLRQRETEVRLEMEGMLEEQFKDLKRKLLQQQVLKMDKLSEDHNKQIVAITNEHKIEMEKLLRKFSLSLDNEGVMKKTIEDSQYLRQENNDMKEELERARERAHKLEVELADVKVKLSGYQGHFAEKVAEVDDKYVFRIRDLMAENTDLRKAYIRKCVELFNVKAKAEEVQGEELVAAKEILLTVIASKSGETIEGDTEETKAAYSGIEDIKHLDLDRPRSAPNMENSLVEIRVDTEGKAGQCNLLTLPTSHSLPLNKQDRRAVKSAGLLQRRRDKN